MKTTKLIKEYVKLLFEAATNPLFKIRDLKKMKSRNEVLEYASAHLEFLGKGSSRAAYRISPRKVLKIAINERGIAQNEAEADIYTSPKSKPIVAKMYDYDPRYSWLISELVRPLEVGEFFYFFDIEFDDFCKHFKRALLQIKRGELSLDNLEDSYEDVELEANNGYYSFFEAALRTALAGDLLAGDICYEQHWGVTGDDRVVIYDYGFTESVRKQHYAQLPSQEETENPEPSSPF